ncbi:MAG: electron transport complex subunit RsxC [Gammaproteobacteria bacterium]|nr:electron transport complex subunit RsxC [Gammaproteobacteria bacterium]MCW8841626.1 electron transport complex subunit RsxC [Gammaproteobacteria bacterium]MCW8927609.1 electron transport complex subunit RsxC [Gammaproteobacteria bacterium]MCW8958526.1 electron transport complex subunit RsxC [Gammaproteobacteria bacterium]MCW8973409.1 electron transport complex subunit RsxC [Gammaproteobacteria bacterium]
MGLLFSLRRSFAHGVHPEHHKEQTADLPIQRVPFCSRYVMPLGQHIGAPARPVVEVGQRVQRGQLIGEPGAFVSTALHSPVTGTVRDIGPHRYIDGNFRPAIEIEADPYATQQLPRPTPIDWRSLDIEQFIAQVQHAGIVGMGGAAFPSHVKYAIPEGQQIDDLLVNGAECEPYLTNDHRLMMERPEAVIHGTEIVRQKLGAKRATIGVEKNKPESIAALKAQIGERPIEVVALEVKYPQGAEKMLIKAVYGIEVPAGELPRDVGVAVNNVGTIVAIADYFDSGMPLIERIVTVSGPGVAEPANLIVPLGTPIREVLRFCGGLKESTREVIMGGPMMGTPIADLDAPILKGSSGILAFTAKETGRPPEYPCIRCGRCLEACPYFLNPSRLAKLGRARMFEEMKEQFHVMDCVECGACTFACPSNIPIVQLIRTAKDNLRQRKG